MNFMQQQQIAQAQAMQRQMAAGGQYGGMTPQQAQMAAAYGGGAGNPYAAGGTPYVAGGNQYGAAGVTAGHPYASAPPQYAPPTPAAGGDSTVVAVTFPDGCIVGFDRMRNELILNGKTSNMRLPHRSMPARPNRASLAQAEEDMAVTPPVEKTGTMTKLGWKKSMFGESWQPRFFKLTANSLSYHKDPSSPALGTIAINSGLSVNIAHSGTPARKNRYEDNDRPGMGAMMTMQVGQMVSATSGVVGKDNCVELICSPQIGTMLDGIMSNNVVGLAFGGGLQDARKTAMARTYYLQCSSLAEAEQWASAIRNNIKALPKDQGLTGGNPIGGAGGYGGLNNVMNNVNNMKNNIADSQDPSKSLGWFKSQLATQLPIETIFQCLDRFYNELDRNGVVHP